PCEDGKSAPRVETPHEAVTCRKGRCPWLVSERLANTSGMTNWPLMRGGQVSSKRGCSGDGERRWQVRKFGRRQRPCKRIPGRHVHQATGTRHCRHSIQHPRKRQGKIWTRSIRLCSSGLASV